MFATPAECILKDFVEFGDTGCADHEQSPPYQRTHAAEHYAKLINRNGRYRRFRHANSLSKRKPTVLNLMTPRNLPLSALSVGDGSTPISRVTTMGKIAASIGHEVNQPLAGIVTNANASLRWLSRDSPNLTEACEAIRRIIRDGNRAGDVISRMRALFKKASTTKEQLDVNETIEEVVILTQSEARRNKVALRMEPAAGFPAVMGDRVQLQQVVMNLILNGIEAMSTVEDRERDLVIRTQRGEGNEVRVVVQDSGIGFDPLSAERIFDAFHTTKPGGLGMGLSISRSIVESHGGRLWAVPSYGPGATFQFTLLECR
jgi:C4-dicarboxylate-specific signal transduction histidine kinase